MPKPKKRIPKEQRERRTLDAAMKVFARRGFRGANTKELAQAAGVSEAMVYKLFGSKKKLYKGIIRRKLESSGDGSEQMAAAAAQPPSEFFTEIARMVFDDARRDPDFLRLLFFSALEGEELSEMFVETSVTGFIEFIAEYIKAQIKKGVFRKVDPHFHAVMFLGMMTECLLVRDIFRIARFRKMNEKAAVRDVVELFLKGISRP